MTPIAFSQVYKGVKSVTRAIGARVAHLFELVSTNEDRRRREYILNVILTISICFLSILEITIVYNYFTFEHGSYDGFAPLQFGALILFCVGLFVASKKGHAHTASYLLIAVYAGGAIYGGWTWGESLPATLLATALVIVTSSVLIGSTFGLSMASVMIVVLAILGIHEREVLGVPSWHYEKISFSDIIVYSTIFMFISFIAWLSNREITKSLYRARTSEKLLELERNTLEQRIAERTKELAITEKTRIQDLERAAQFGTLSQGLFHDLMSPLSSISLYMEQLKTLRVQPKEFMDAVHNMIDVSRRMNSFMENLKQYISKDNGIRRSDTVDIVKEIDIVRDILAYKARMSGVTMTIDMPESLIIHANHIRIHQVILNLLSNAVEACESPESDDLKQKLVAISLIMNQNSIMLSVTDTGCGISAEHMLNVFKKSFTTKKHGTGSGLMTIKSVVEKELRGSISVRSIKGEGTTFIITIPHDIHGTHTRPNHSGDIQKTPIFTT